MLARCSGRCEEIVFALLGLVSLASGVLFNEVTYTFFCTPGVRASHQARAFIWLSDLALVLGGVILIKRSRVRRAFDAAMMVVATLVIVLLVEGVFGGLLILSSPRVEYGGDYVWSGHQGDPRLGGKLKPNRHESNVLKVGGQTIYDVMYTIDAEGRRVTPQSNLSERREFLLLFGCSYTFGIGVKDDETIPFYTAQEAPRYRVYNYGVAGYGSHQMLVQLQSDALRSEIAEPSGIAVYAFIDHHVRRVSGTSDGAWSHLWDGPFFIVDDAGQLVTRGGFRWERPLLTFLNYAVSRSQTATYFNRSFPPMTDAHVDLTVRIIKEARDVFATKFGSDAFYVVVYPQSKLTARLIPRLERAGVKYLDYSQLFEKQGNGLFIPNDGHPTPAAHHIVARQLASDLGIAIASHLAE